MNHRDELERLDRLPVGTRFLVPGGSGQGRGAIGKVLGLGKEGGIALEFVEPRAKKKRDGSWGAGCSRTEWIGRVWVLPLD